MLHPAKEVKDITRQSTDETSFYQCLFLLRRFCGSIFVQPHFSNFSKKAQYWR